MYEIRGEPRARAARPDQGRGRHDEGERPDPAGEGPAHVRLVELQQAIEAQERKSGLGGGIHSQPASVYLGLWSVQRKIAALRIVEAVRAHLAASNGKFPERLEDIRGLSIPLDPLTGLPFEWKVEGPVATLTAPPVPIETKGSAHLIDYRLRVR